MSENTAELKKESTGLVAQLIPFLLPLISICIVVFLGYRWYSLRANQVVAPPTIAPKVEIESLDPAEESKLQSMAKGIGDYKVLKLTATAATDKGEIRYEVKDSKVYASLVGTLKPLKDQEKYQLWLKPVGATDWQTSAVLVENKAGYLATFALKEEKLPLEVKVTHEGVVGNDTQKEIIVLQGSLVKN